MTDFHPFAGHCQCGTVRYRVTAPAEDFYHCHCAKCRRLHGALFATYAIVARDHLVIEAGAADLVTFDSSPGVHRRRCARCGCQLFIDVDRKPGHVWYSPATAEGHPGHAPEVERHIFVGSKVAWYEIADGLPQVAESSAGE